MNQLVKINFTNAYIQDYVDINTTKNKETLHRLDQFQMMLPSFSNRVVAGRMRASGDYCARAPPEANRGWRGKRSGGVQREAERWCAVEWEQCVEWDGSGDGICVWWSVELD
jgi:hypothetical protein